MSSDDEPIVMQKKRKFCKHRSRKRLRHCIDDDENCSNSGIYWDSLSPEVLVHILNYIPSLKDFGSVAMVNKATWKVVQSEMNRGLDGIRLSYLNEPDGKLNRFDRLIQTKIPDPRDVLEFLQEQQVSNAQLVVLRHMFEHNQLHPNEPQFVLAGGSMLSFYRLKVRTGGTNHPNDDSSSRSRFLWRQRESLDFGDIDIFVMENGKNRQDSDATLRKVLLAAGEEIEKKVETAKQLSQTNKKKSLRNNTYLDDATWDYAVLQNSGTLTMLGCEKKRPLQVVLRRIQCVEELLCFFDLDCCRFAYSGGSVLYTTIEGLRAVELKRNFVSMEHIHNPMYCRRAIKYGYRGFDTGFGTLHPFSHLCGQQTSIFNNNQYEHSEAVTKDRSDWVDEGLYTSFANASLEEINDLFFSSTLTDTEDEEEQDVDDYDACHDDNGDLILKYRRDKDQLRNELEDSGFAPTFAIHFDSMQNDMFVHIYYQSHLKHKYNIVRCYITGKWFKQTPREQDNKTSTMSHSLDNTDDSNTDDDNDNDSDNDTEIDDVDANFSPEGSAWNQKCASVKRDLTGMVAIVTGARVRIGFATALELLRQGATVIATTRFAADAERRYIKQQDYHEFCDRLIVFPLNLQCVEDVQSFVQFVASNYTRVHILVNNAAQTVRLPLRCYTKLIRSEYHALCETLGIVLDQPDDVDGKTSSSVSSMVHTTQISTDLTNRAASSTDSQELMAFGITIPIGKLHLYSPPPALLSVLKEKQISSIESLPTSEQYRIRALRCMFTNLHPDDLKDFPNGKVPVNPLKAGRNNDRNNSWRLEPTEVNPVELFETQTINHLAPTMLLNGLVPYLTPAKKDPDTIRNSNSSANSNSTGVGGPSYVINVTSIEGQFSVDFKESQHIHTNMSKAALNMLTKSGAHFYAKKGILVNSVDTGWVSSTIPTWKKPPLTKHDAAMRILYPILTESKVSGKLYKNYKVVPW